MRPAIDDCLTARGGAAAREHLLRVVSRNELDDEVRRGRLISPFPRAYCRPWDADVPPVRRQAALSSVGDPVALSHTTALDEWGLQGRELQRPDLQGQVLQQRESRIHVTVPVRRHPIGRTPGLVVHRTRVPTRVQQVAGRRVVEPAAAVVRSWPLLGPTEGRSMVIEAARTGLVTPTRLDELCVRAVGMSGRASLRRLVALLAAGCESELEIWGCLAVFDVPGLRHGVRQYPLSVGARHLRIDLAFLPERVAVELDGESFHSSPEQRERDRRRDAALASIGWLTLRFGYRRLHEDVAGCRRETLATLAARH